MLVPHRATADLIVHLAAQGGLQGVNRRHLPPLSVYARLIKRGYATLTREGPPRTRTSAVVLTARGWEAAGRLARAYGVTREQLSPRR